LGGRILLRGSLPPHPVNRKVDYYPDVVWKNRYRLDAVTSHKMTLMSDPSAYERAAACVLIAIGFLIVGLSSLLLGNVPVAGGLLVASLLWLLVSLFYLTKEHRVKPSLKT
jgi:hypothetical protein